MCALASGSSIAGQGVPPAMRRDFDQDLYIEVRYALAPLACIRNFGLDMTQRDYGVEA